MFGKGAGRLSFFFFFFFSNEHPSLLACSAGRKIILLLLFFLFLLHNPKGVILMSSAICADRHASDGVKQTRLQLLLWSSRAWSFSYSSFLPTGPVHGYDDGVLPLHIHDPGEYMDPRFMLMGRRYHRRIICWWSGLEWFSILAHFLIRSGAKKPALMTPAAFSFFHGIK